MYFTICTPLHPYEVMMQGIPNFLPRGHGTYIYRRETIPAAQTDCQYCLHYRSKKCSLEECPFLECKIANRRMTMENKVEKYVHDEFGELEVWHENGEIWFPATECAKKLGYAQWS